MRAYTITLFIMLVSAKDAWADETTDPAKAQTVDSQAPSRATTTEAPVFLHVMSDETVTIQRDGTNEVVCTSPCDKDVPKDGRYHVGGYRPSPSFTLTPPQNKSNRADLRVKPGTSTGFWAGIGGLSLSALLIGGGVATLVYGMENRAAVAGGDGTETDNTYTDTMTVGTALVLGGAVVAIGGGALLIANARTKVDGNIQSASSTPTNTPAPAARTQANAGSSGLPKPTYLSIFTGTF